MSKIFGNKKFDITYRSDDFTISKTVFYDEPWDNPETISDGDIILKQIPNSCGNGWFFKTFVNENTGQEIEELMNINSDIPESFIRNGVKYTYKATFAQFNKSGEATAKSYGKPSEQFISKMQSIKKRIPKNKRKDMTLGNGLFSF